METAAFLHWEGVEAMFLNRVKEITNVHNGKQKLHYLLAARAPCEILLPRKAKQKSLNM